MKRIALIILLLVLAALAVGCGGDKDEAYTPSPTAEANTEATEPTSSEEPVVSNIPTDKPLDYHAARELANGYLAQLGFKGEDTVNDYAAFICYTGVWVIVDSFKDGKVTLEIDSLTGELVWYLVGEYEPNGYDFAADTATSELVRRANDYAAANYDIDLSEYYTYVVLLARQNQAEIYFDKYAPDVYVGDFAGDFTSDYYEGIKLEYKLRSGELVSCEEYSDPRNERIVLKVTRFCGNDLWELLLGCANLEGDGETSYTFAQLKEYYEVDHTEEISLAWLYSFSEEAEPETIRVIKAGEITTVELKYAAEPKLDAPAISFVWTNDAEFSQGTLLNAQEETGRYLWLTD